jgi:hypothetical protein
MKGILAIGVAVGVLLVCFWCADAQLNDGRYCEVLQAQF